MSSSSPAVPPLYETLRDPAEYLAAYRALMDEPTNRLRIAAVAETLSRVPPTVRRVIDIASGGGAYVPTIRAGAAALRDARFVAVDRQFACVGGYRLNHAGAIGAVADVTVLPFRPGSFEMALCLDIIEHLDDDVGFLREVGRLLTPRGWILVCTHNSWSVEHVIGSTAAALCRRKWVGWDPTHVRFYNARTLKRALDAAGFHLTEFNGTYYVPFHLPARALSWPIERAGFQGASRAIYKILRAPGYVANAAFEAMSRNRAVSRLGWGIIALAQKRQ